MKPAVLKIFTNIHDPIRHTLFEQTNFGTYGGVFDIVAAILIDAGSDIDFLTDIESEILLDTNAKTI